MSSRLVLLLNRRKHFCSQNTHSSPLGYCPAQNTVSPRYNFLEGFLSPTLLTRALYNQPLVRHFCSTVKHCFSLFTQSRETWGNKELTEVRSNIIKPQLSKKHKLNMHYPWHLIWNWSFEIVWWKAAERQLIGPSGVILYQMLLPRSNIQLWNSLTCLNAYQKYYTIWTSTFQRQLDKLHLLMRTMCYEW